MSTLNYSPGAHIFDTIAAQVIERFGRPFAIPISFSVQITGHVIDRNIEQALVYIAQKMKTDSRFAAAINFQIVQQGRHVADLLPDLFEGRQRPTTSDVSMLGAKPSPILLARESYD